MRLARCGETGAERPALVDSDGQLRDISAHVSDINATTLAEQSLAQLATLDPASLPLIDANTRLAPPVAGIRKIVCIGLNYHDHAAEVGKTAPDEPMLFLKATSSICGPNDPIEAPLTATKTDWEVELGIVIGKRAKNISKDTALGHIAGYVCANDVSERAFQSERAGQFTKGKSHDTFCPIGPWLVTPDEASDVGGLALWTEVNGTRYQDGSTCDLVFDVATSIAQISEFMTLEPGDLILTGTPAGVGKGQKPDPIYLQPGDTMRCGVEGLGVQNHVVIEARS
ncbi:2-hydroxyhepta-2,4-diene-1,7-dioate isomerase [Ruegeria sp. HKCCD4884]|uniref:fumarylacetoacetate hydrolase family protein n=1 Tax=Ruegeria sp. HKCCD4884 TaxID=2683022 RepID=UPI001492FF69|nr:fumarylacetoacetate hydrolase family protein [Ruegeria sp. HKCCD4884]NOD95287.1 2-hydroxyhepta-2,4-diene-1,7-dioate isomerase [Ruegeria sp. HKCCD4884]